MATTEIRPGPVPLGAFPHFASSDLDEARSFVARTFCDHSLGQTRADERLDACHNHVRGQTLSLNYIRYGADVSIEPGELGSFYLIQIPIRGEATIRHGGQNLEATPRRASLLNADRHTAMRWHSGCEKILIQIDKAALTGLVETLSGHALAGSVLFDPELDFTRPGMGLWGRRVRALFQAADRGEAFTGPGDPWQRMREEELMGALLALQPSNVRHLIDTPGDRLHPRHVKRALAYMRANLDQPLSLGDIAASAGVTGRTLQLAFRDAFAMTPLQVLRRERLKQVRSALLTRPPETPIADIATRWGFSHMGRFSDLYRREYGCLPSETRPLDRA
ncbi:AraC family transcriptional regulator [Amorphus orientalis]|uniref:AraC-like DNA-binding protein n=1 Tax=Amorphus orientalis TaxID=649198 RepID=A0AAE4AQ38_9HYPH|nr:AraC family transcriptional regulator [Amorphus orientalis]MDQ0313601.1 AraC-like DNA-binding protein [Amorphus orientalis]